MVTRALAATVLREVFGSRQLVDRVPEPDLVMDGTDEVAAYTSVGRVQGPMAAAYLFHAARISLTIQGCKNVIDLACGPATQLIRVAELHPNIAFRGIDLSPGMLNSARDYARERGLKNIEFSTGDITKIDFIPDQSVDGVISTVALHHLPTLDHLRGTFREITRVLKPGGAVYLADFGRLKSSRSIEFFAYKDRDTQPEVFCRDYEYSLRAAFLFEELARLTKEELPAHVGVCSTFPIPFFTIIKSSDRGMDPSLKTILKRKRDELEPRYRADLDDIRRLFWMGGLRDDPFH